MIFKIINLLDKYLEKATSYTLVLCVFSMLIFSVVSIILRPFNISFMWLEPMVRHLVFISIFLGGIIATGRGTHIGIDIISKYLETKNELKLKNFLTFFTNTISSLTLFWLSYTSISFIEIELEYGKVVFFGIHSGFLVMIIPLGFCLIALRFFFASIKYLLLKNMSQKVLG